MSAVVSVFFCVIALSPLPFGANRPWAWLTISGMCFLIMATWCVFYMRGATRVPPLLHSVPVRLATGLFFCAIVWGLGQALPLPASWVESLPVPTAALYGTTAAVIAPQAVTETLPLSIDSSVTSEIGLRSAAYFCFYLLLLLLIDTRSRLLMLCYVIVLSGLFQAVFGSFMTLSGLEYLLGTKKYAYLGFATGTFINRNHFAGYLEMALATGMGLLMTESKNRAPEVSRRWRARFRSVLALLLSGKAVLRLMLIVMVSGLILSRSRMGNAAFFNSLLITGLIAIASSRSFRKPRVYGLLISIIIIDIFLLGSWFGLEKVVKRMEQTALVSESRDEVDQYLIPMISDFGLTGSGNGTFIYAFPGYLKHSISSLYNHAHNDYLEMLSDMGYIGFSCLVGVALISLWQAFKALRHRRSSFVRAMGFAGFMGSLSLLIHSSVDFNLQIPANAMLFITMLAIPTIALTIDKNQIKSYSEFAK